jgi:DNA-nicking Smr family endonuclease
LHRLNLRVGLNDPRSKNLSEKTASSGASSRVRPSRLPAATAEPESPAAKQPEEKPAPTSKTASTSSAPAPPQPKRHPPTHLDTPTLDKLAKGRLPIEARVDLHGMTQDEAYSLLYIFLSRAHARSARYVLVITGRVPRPAATAS